MAIVDFSLLATPTPQPYDKNLPTQNQENAAFLFMQIVELFKNAGAQLELPFNVTLQNLPPINVSISNATLGMTLQGGELAEIRDALKDLKFNDVVIDFGFLRVNLVGQVLEY